MSESEPTQYSLQVKRIRNVRRKSKVPDLYVRAALAGQVEKTGVIKENEPPTGGATLTFSSSDPSAVLEVCVSERSIAPMRNHRLGFVRVKLADLLEMCVCGEAQLSLSASSERLVSAPTVVVHLYFKNVDIEKRVGIDIERARENIQQIERSANLADSTIDAAASIIRKLDEIVKALDDITPKIHPYLNLAWQALSALYRVISHQFQTDKKLVDLVRTMEDAFEFARDAKTLADKTEKLKQVIEELLKETLECCNFVKGYTAPNFLRRVVKVNSRQKIDDQKDRFVTLKKSLDSGIALHSAFIIDRMSHKVGEIDLQQRLKLLEEQLRPIKSDTSKRPRCLPQTRTEYQRKINNFLFSNTTQNILWLHGIAGSGKSTIAATVADYCDDNSRLAAFIFFERGRGEYTSVIQTIAYQLASFEASIAQHVITATDRFRNLTGSLPARQFEKFLLEPLTAAAKDLKGPIIIILDALDECGTAEQRREILELLSMEFQELPMDFRFFVTSRPENDIMTSLSSRRHISNIRLDHTSEDARNDLSLYVDKEMRRLVKEAPSKWQWSTSIKLLSDAANGLFIWASTAVRMVSISDDPFEQLQDLVSDVRSVEEYGLDVLYATVLEQCGISWGKAKSRDRFTKVLALILLAKSAASDDVIDSFLGLGPGKACSILARLCSVLAYEPGMPIRPHHVSFTDYLLSSTRSGCKPWFIDAGYHNRLIAVRCFDVMEVALKFNICDLDSSFMRNGDVLDIENRIKNRIPPSLEYACRFWAEHLCDVPYSFNPPELPSKLATFAQSSLLYWFEVLSLTMHFKRLAGRALLDAILWTGSNMSEISSFLWDAYRLCSIFALPISESVPHIYLSALSLAQGESIVSDHFSSAHPTIHVQKFGVKPLQPCMKTFYGHDDIIYSVAFSPDGRRVVSGSGDATIRMWDAESCEVVSGPFSGHTGPVCSAAFSPDGKRVVSGSIDETVRVWDAESGEVISGLLKGHTGPVWSVAFSPDGRRIVSGSADKTIRIWDAESGKAVAGPFKGGIGWVWSVAFSPDGKRVVSGSDNKTIRVWDAESGKVVAGLFEGHTDSVRSVRFSPDGKRIVSGSVDETVRVWDAESGKIVAGPFEGHNDSVRSVSFSPDGKCVVSGSVDRTIRVWDSENGKVVAGPFKGHTGWVWSVAFSPDGKRIVSSSDDETIRIWDAERGGVVGPFEEHSSSVSSIAFSPDRKHIVSCSSDMRIRMWDTESGEVVSGPFKSHTGPVCSVAFSPDRKHIVSGSVDKTVRIWDAMSGRVVTDPFEGHTDCVWSVAFSPDGKRLVSSSEDKTIRVWDVESGRVVAGPFKGHTDSVRTVSFSPNGKRIVSGSDDKTIRVWNAESGEIVVGPLEGHTDRICSVAFSPNGKRLVSGSVDRTIRLWDVESGRVVAGPFKGHTDSVRTVSFSPDGIRVVSGSDDETIRVWDVEKDEVVAGLSEEQSDSVSSVAFSPDGIHVILCSSDMRIRIWDVESGEVASAPFEGHPDLVRSIAFSADRKRIVSGLDDGTIQVHDAESGKIVASPFEGHASWVNSVAFSSDGKRVVSGSEDGTIRVYDLQSGEVVAGPFKGHTDCLTSVAFSLDGKRVVSSSIDETIRVWNAESGEVVAGPFEEYTCLIYSVAFSPNGKYLVSGSDDKTIRVWDAESGQIVAGPFDGHTGCVRCVAFSPDGKHLVSGSDDKTLRVWDTKSMEVIAGPFEGHTGWVHTAAFSPDGKHIASCSRDQTVRVWDCTYGKVDPSLLVSSVGSDTMSLCIDSPTSGSAVGDMTAFLAGLGITNKWIMSKDGWLLGKNGELLLWIPEDMRPTLWQPPNVTILNCQFSTRLEFTGCTVGPGWHEAHK